MEKTITPHLIKSPLTPHDQNLVYYKGAFSAHVLSRISTNIRRKVSGSRQVVKKVFSIFIELGQNVALYSPETNNYGDGGEGNGQGIGLVYLCDQGDSYQLTVGNLVDKESARQLASKLDEINGLDEKSLRKLKILKRESPREEGKDGGNIGLIHVALQAETPISYELVEKTQDYDYITLKISVKK